MKYCTASYILTRNETPFSDKQRSKAINRQRSYRAFNGVLFKSESCCDNQNMTIFLHTVMKICFLHVACGDRRSALGATRLSGLSRDRRFTANRFSDDQTWPRAEAARKSAPSDASRAAPRSDLYCGISSI